MSVNRLSDVQLAGQRLMVGFDGTEFDEHLRYLIESLYVGGVILFARNVIDPEQIKTLCGMIQDCAAACGQPPMFVAIDQEGGQVARLREPFTRFPGNAKMQGRKDAEHFARTTASELKAAGINMNLAPVLDVAFDGEQSIMAQRSFGPDPRRVADLGVTVIEHLQRQGVLSVAKHFPGIGRTVLDSHLQMPVLDIDPDTLRQTDLIPFAAAISRDVAGIMLSHILYPKLDARWPASLSTAVARDLLRGQMGYQGLVVTDDLDMLAIKNHYDLDTVINRILAADIDMALICHQGPDIRSAFELLAGAVGGGHRARRRAEASAQRILNLKKKFRLP